MISWARRNRRRRSALARSGMSRPSTSSRFSAEALARAEVTDPPGAGWRRGRDRAGAGRITRDPYVIGTSAHFRPPTARKSPRRRPSPGHRVGFGDRLAVGVVSPGPPTEPRSRSKSRRRASRTTRRPSLDHDFGADAPGRRKRWKGPWDDPFWGWKGAGAAPIDARATTARIRARGAPQGSVTKQAGFNGAASRHGSGYGSRGERRRLETGRSGPTIEGSREGHGRDVRTRAGRR